MRKLLPAPGIALSLLLLLVSITPAAAGPDCLEYEPAPVKLTGKAVTERQIMRPNMPITAKGNDYVYFSFLLLDRPVCVKGPEGDPYSPPVTGIKKIQLVLSDGQHQAFNTLIKKKIVVTGKLFAAHTHYHRTPVLITVESMTPAD
jgi:hypothetical protein